jgi:hypothetical protein
MSPRASADQDAPAVVPGHGGSRVGPLAKKDHRLFRLPGDEPGVTDFSIAEDLLRAGRVKLPWSSSGCEVIRAGGQPVATCTRAQDASWASISANRYAQVLPEVQWSRCRVRALEAELDRSGREIDKLLRTVPAPVWRQCLRDLGWTKAGPGAHWFPRDAVNGDRSVEDRGGDDWLCVEELDDVAAVAGMHRSMVLAGMLLATVRSVGVCRGQEPGDGE